MCIRRETREKARHTLVHRYNAGNQVGIVHHYTRKILYYNLKLEIKNPVLQSEIRN
jgi:hypothetical protein